MRSPTQKVSGFNGGWLYNGRECIHSQSFRATAVSMLLVVSVSKALLKPASAKMTNTPHEQRHWGEWGWREVLAMAQCNEASTHRMCCEFAGAKHVRFKNTCSTRSSHEACTVDSTTYPRGSALLIYSTRALVGCLQSAWTLLNKCFMIYMPSMELITKWKIGTLAVSPPRHLLNMWQLNVTAHLNRNIPRKWNGILCNYISVMVFLKNHFKKLINVLLTWFNF